jgi:protein TonB
MMGGGSIRSDREDRLFRRLFFGGQLLAATLLVVTVAAGPSAFPIAAEDGPRTIELRFEMLQEAVAPEVVAPEVVAPEPPPPVEPDPPVVERVVDPAVERAALPAEARVLPEPREGEALPEAELVEEPAEPPVPPRRIYGTRRVLANGLGGDVAVGGLATRVGNTLSGHADSLVATPDDLAGGVASLSSVDVAPEPLRRVLPEYSDELRRERASGTVTARLLIDREGTVRKVEILSDFGLDSAQLATQAFVQFRFRPARRDGEPVSVWIVHKIRFEFQE